MKYIYGKVSDIGIVKDINQDKVEIISDVCMGHNVCMAIVCDGVGGLSQGEVASEFVVNQCRNWFNKRLEYYITKENYINAIKDEWDNYINNINLVLLEYGKKNNIKLGTTLCCMLLIDEEYLVANVGDSRAYLLSDELVQITKDQSLIQYELDNGIITENEAKNDTRKNVILQSIGTCSVVKIDYYNGKLKSGNKVLMCTDGFRNCMGKEELHKILGEKNHITDSEVEKDLFLIVDELKKRKERDNISAVLVHIH